MPIYPAAMSTLAQPTTGPAHRHRTRHAASALSFAAAALALIGSFLPLYSTTLDLRGEERFGSTIVATATSWGMEVAGGVGGPTIPDTSAVPMNGYPLVVACFILVAAAIVSWFAAIPGTPATTHRTAAVTVGVGAAFLLGTAWTVALQGVATVDSVEALNDSGVGVEVSADYGAGHWLILTAAVLGVAATVLVLIPARDRLWLPAPVDPNMPTPPYGVALPMAALPHSPVIANTVDPLTGQPENTLQVNPATGMPHLGPIVIPDPPPPAQPHAPAVPPTEDPLADPRDD